MQEVLGAAPTGHGVVLDVSGEAGIGKTRLVEEVLGRLGAGRGVTVWCQPYLSAIPYGAARVLLGAAVGMDLELPAPAAGAWLTSFVGERAPSLLPQLPLLAIPFGADVAATRAAELVDPRFRRAAIERAVGDLLEEVMAVRAFVRIEDLHRADEASHALFDALAGRLDHLPWLVCTTRLPDSEPIGGARLVRRHRVELGPLRRDATRALARAAAGTTAGHPRWDEIVAERSAGHPVFTIELAVTAASQGVDALPESVEAAITARIDRLAVADRVLLRDASVLGLSFDVDLLAAALAIPSGDLRARIATLGNLLVASTAGSVRFLHSLVHQVAYEGLSFRRRRAVHNLVGEALEAASRDRSDEDAGLLSLHFHRAERRDKAWRYSLEAARRAQAAYANAEARALYARALESAPHLPALDGEEWAATAEALGDVCELSASYVEAARAYATARRLLEAASTAQVRLLRKQGVLKERAGQYTLALRWYGRGLRHLGSSAVSGQPRPTEAVVEEAQLDLSYAGVRWRQGRYRECARLAGQAIGVATLAGHKPSLAHGLYLLSLASSQLGEIDALAPAKEALRIYEEQDDQVGQANVLNNLGIAAYYEGRWDESIELYERSRAARIRAGDVLGAAIQANNIGEVLSDQGRLDDALQLFASASDAFLQVDYPFGATVIDANVARAAVRAGRPQAALDPLAEAERRFEAMGSEAFAAEAAVRVVEALLGMGRVADAARRADEILGRVRTQPGYELVVVAALRGQAWAGLLGRRWAEAAGLLDDAEQRAMGLDARFELALVLQARVHLAAASGRPDAASVSRLDALRRALGIRCLPPPPRGAGTAITPA